MAKTTPYLNMTDAFPLQVKQHSLRKDADEGAFCHWHPEVEFTVVTQGGMEYLAGGQSLRLNTGDGLFLNADCVHAAWPDAQQDCAFFTVKANPTLLYGQPDAETGALYVQPLLSSAQYTARVLLAQNELHAAILRILTELSAVDTAAPCAELLLKSHLCALWASLYADFRQITASPQHKVVDLREMLRLKHGLEYMRAHYAEKLSLDAIAESCGVSKSECCRLFQRMLRQTPFDYLLRYRVRQSIPLLLEGGRSVTELAWITGFSGASYFSEIFRRYYGCSPTEYRKALIYNEADSSKA